MTFKASGNVFYSSNAATFSNVTIGGGTLLVGEGFQGTVAGYVSGGDWQLSPTSLPDGIEKFPFATDANATNTGTLSLNRTRASGQSSVDNGYSSGGTGFPIGTAASNVIDKFPFATNANATDVGDLSRGTFFAAGHSSSSDGFTSGGGLQPNFTNIIDKFPFAANANATDVGDLAVAMLFLGTGISSSTNGYTSGGFYSPPPANTAAFNNIIQKFPFASGGLAQNIADATALANKKSNQSSKTHGYSSGGAVAPGDGKINVIDKFPFATDANATDVGDLTVARWASTGVSSSVSGYTAAGITQFSPDYSNTIDKFPFATDANATDVGDLTKIIRDGSGQQN